MFIIDKRKCQTKTPTQKKKKHLAGEAIASGAMRLSAIAALQVLTLNPVSMPKAYGQLPPVLPSPEAQKESPQNSNNSEQAPQNSNNSEQTQQNSENPEQAPQNSETDSPSLTSAITGILSGSNGSNAQARPVRLDGRTLFSVAQTERQRDRAIERQLQQLVAQIETHLENRPQALSGEALKSFINEKLQIYNNPLHRSPVIFAKWDGQEELQLVTVTSLDAEQMGVSPEMVADRWQQEIRLGVLKAMQERQPAVIQERFAQAAIVALGIFVVSLTLASYQRQLQQKRKRILAETPPPIEEIPPIPGSQMSESTEEETIASEAIEQRQQTESIGELQHNMNKQEQLNLNDLQRRLAQFGQIAIWGGGSYAILGLFPYSRWLQPLLLSFLPLPLKLVGVVLGTYVGVRLSAIAIDRFFAALQDGNFVDAHASRRLALRFSTFAGVFKSVSAGAFIGIGTLMALSAIGIDLAPILAGAGLIGLGISLASQSLIKDTINGFLILFEDQYAVGDVIVVGDVGGLVETMNLRITQLRNGEGRLITIPNSAISVVQNLSKEWARVDLTLEVAYQNDVDKVLMGLQQLADEIYSEPQWRDKIIDPPEVLGIDNIDSAGLLIRIWIKTKPLQHWSVGREFRRRIKMRLDEMGIAIGVPQQSVVFHSSLELLKAHQNGNGNNPALLSEHSHSEG